MNVSDSRPDGHMLSSVIGDILLVYCELQVKGLEFQNPQSTHVSHPVPLDSHRALPGSVPRGKLPLSLPRCPRPLAAA